MKKILAFVVLAAMTIATMAQNKSVAVLNPICRDNSVNIFYQQIVRGAMESAVTMTDEFVAFDRTAFDKVLEEHKFQQSGVVDDAQIRRMGVYAGVDFVLITEVSAYDGYMSILVKILNIETGESSKGLSELMEQTPPIVQSSCKELARKIFGIVDVDNGVRKGTLQLPEGRYEGEIRNGKPHGKGKIYYEASDSKERMSYDGDWENGLRSGYGVLLYKDGRIYKGVWVNNSRSGKGTLFFPNGSRIEGTKAEGEWFGTVTMILVEGEKYVGEWPAKGKIVDGIYYYKNGDRYEGGYNENFDKHGLGKAYFANGDRFEGMYENGKENGKGTYYKSTYTLVGNWENGILSGFVICYAKDGHQEYGHYVNGKPDGEWTYKSESGEYQKGRFSNGVMTTQYH